MSKACTSDHLPESLKLKKISFVALWSYDVLNLTTNFENSKRSYSFGYLYDDGETEKISRACTVIEHREIFSLETRSMIWQIAEIDVERQNEWLIFSRQQNDLSREALSEFLVDSRNYLEHFRDEHERLQV